MTENDIHHFAAQAKMASLSSEFSEECFDFDRTSVCFLSWRIGVKAFAKGGRFSFTRRKRCFGGSSNCFGKSLICQSFVLAKEMAESSVGCSYFRLKFYN